MISVCKFKKKIVVLFSYCDISFLHDRPGQRKPMINWQSQLPA